MQNPRRSGRFSSLRLVTLAATAALLASALAGVGAIGCSSNPTPDPAAALAEACTALGALCDAGAFDANVAPPSFDAALPCELTGSCPLDATPPITNDGDAGAHNAGPQCTYTGSCLDGTQYETCTLTSDAGACVAAVVFPTEATDFLCDSCLNCAAASASAAAKCAAQHPPVIDAGPLCTAPPVLHPEIQPGVYCPFTALGAVDCPAGEQCCEGPSSDAGDTSTCQTIGATCPVPGSLVWQCDGPVDCASSAAGPVCCAGGAVAHDPVCNYDRGSGFEGSHCAQSCGAGEISICAAATDPCTGGATCTPFKVAGLVLGTCL